MFAVMWDLGSSFGSREKHLLRYSLTSLFSLSKYPFLIRNYKLKTAMNKIYFTNIFSRTRYLLPTILLEICKYNNNKIREKEQLKKNRRIPVKT